MSNESLPVCPQCGAVLKASAPAGLCPNCLMALNLKTETVFTDETPTAQPPLPPEQLAPHFPQLEILAFLGRGGMGVVYKARQKTLNRLVALKLLAPERVGDAKFAERFTREAQALAALNHPNIVTIHDFGQAGGFYFLLMEFVDGLNLRQLLRARKFTPEEALAIVPPLCDALQFAHDRGIIHRDIKPENLLLDKAGRVKVADFGIAKMIEPESGRADLAVSPEIEAAQPHGPTGVMGTPGYSAPEQKTDPQRVDSRADIYSLGVVFYEMLTGELPGKRIEPPSRKVQIDVRLDEVVLRALEKQPALRYQQVSEVKTCVETIAASPPGGSRREEAHSESGPASQSAAVRDAVSHLKAPAIGLLVAGIIDLVAVFFLLAAFVVASLSYQAFVAGATTHPPPLASRLLFFLPLGVTFLAAGVIIVFGAVRMQRLRSYGWSVAASILAMITPPGLLLGLPFGIWALIVLKRREIKAGFEAASRKRTMESATAPPHFSRMAIVGACCLVLTVVAGGAALLAASQSMYLALQTPHLSRPLPPQVLDQGRAIFLVAILSQAIGAVCALTGTVLGWIAVSQIRRSNGRIRGLGLAMFDGMLFPSLALIAVLWLVWFSLLDWIFPLLQMFRVGKPSLVFSMLVWLPWFAGSLWLCRWMAKQVRRAVNRPLPVSTPGGPGQESAPSEAEGRVETQPSLASAANPQRYGGWAFGFFLAGTLGTLLLMTISSRHELALIFGGVTLVLAFVFGLMSWRARLGKFVVVALTLMLTVIGVAALVWMAADVPARQAEAEAQRNRTMKAQQIAQFERAKTQDANTAFSRELEKSLNSLGSDAGNHFLDLDAAHYAQPPRQYSSWSRERKHEWLRENGVDLMIMGNGNQPWNLLTPVDNETKFTKVPADSWERGLAPALNEARPEPTKIFQFIDAGVELLQLRLEGRPTHPDNIFAFQTANGTRGLLQISGIKFATGGKEIGLKLRLKRFQTSPVSSQADPAAGNQTTSNIAPRTEYAARLSDGSFVELISLMYESKPKGAAGQTNDIIYFWKPDGSALVGDADWSFTPASGWQADPSYDYRAFVVRWGGPFEAQPCLQTWEFDGKPGAAGSFRITPHAESAGHWMGLIHGFARGQSTATVRFALANGPFVAGPGPGRAWSNSGNTSFGSFLIGEVFDHNGTAAVTLTHNLQGCDYRLRTTTPVARKPNSWVGRLLWEWKQEFTRGAQPQPVFGRIVEGNAMDRQSLETWEFPGVSVKDAGVITFEVRPVQWVEFRNVALNPGKATHPEIRVEDAAAGASSGRRKSEVSQRKFVRLVVDKAAMTFEGQPTTWDGVDTLLDTVADRPRTVLEFAVTSDQITVQQQNEWFGKCAALAKRHGFEYASFIGIQPLGSKGSFDSPAKSVPPISRARPGEFKLTLPNGVSCEVVAVTANPLANQHWWQPDGTPLPQSPGGRVIFHPAGMAREQDLGENEHALLVRCIFPPGAQSARQQTRYTPQPEHLGTLEIQQGSTLAQAAESVSRTLRTMTGGAGGPKSASQVVGLADVVRFPPGTTEVAVQCATAIGPWEALAIFDGTRTTVLVEGTRVLCTHPRQEANGRCLDVTHDVDRQHYALRMMAVFKDGERKEVGLHSGVLSARETQGYVRLEPGQRVENIQEFVLERTPWVRGEIRNIALRPKLEKEAAATSSDPVGKSSTDLPADAPAFGTPQQFPVAPGKADNLDSTYLDLDAGRSTTMRLPIIGGSSWLRNWLEQEGMDVRVTTDPDSAAPFQLTYYNMTVTPMASNAWPKAEAQEVINSLGPRPLKAEPPPLMGGPVIRFFSPKQDRTDCYSFRTREGGVGILQIAGFTDNPRDVKIRYKLVQAGRATNNNSATSRVSLADPPKLQFLAWQDEWKTNQPAAARHPDGSLVTNATELSWLPVVHPTGMDVSLLKLKPEPRFLHLWFSHAAFDQVGLKQISLLDEQGKAVELGGQGSVSGSTHTANDRNGNLGWYTATLSPGGGTNVPTRVTLRLRYTLGPMERTQEVASDFSGMMSLEGGSQLNGIGQNAEARAFIAIAVDTRTMGSRQFGVVAITKDGRELPPVGSGRGGAIGGGVGVEHFDFEVPLADVAKFRIGTNPIRTVEWKDVGLP